MIDKNKKHFRAVNKTNPEDVVDFGVEDIALGITCSSAGITQWRVPIVNSEISRRFVLGFKLDQLKDYDLYYYHEGEWFPYNTEEVEK